MLALLLVGVRGAPLEKRSDKAVRPQQGSCSNDSEFVDEKGHTCADWS